MYLLIILFQINNEYVQHTNSLEIMLMGRIFFPIMPPSLKEAHSVSFENFYLVMFYGNQII